MNQHTGKVPFGMQGFQVCEFKIGHLKKHLQRNAVPYRESSVQNVTDTASQIRKITIKSDPQHVEV